MNNKSLCLHIKEEKGPKKVREKRKKKRQAFCHQDPFLSPRVARWSKIVAVYPKCYKLGLFSLSSILPRIWAHTLLCHDHYCFSSLPGYCVIFTPSVLQDCHIICATQSQFQLLQLQRDTGTLQPPPVCPTLPSPPDNPLGQPCQGMCQLIGNVFRQVLDSSAEGDKDEAALVSTAHPRLEILREAKLTLNTAGPKHSNTEQTWLSKSSPGCPFRSQVPQIPNILGVTENNGSRYRAQGRGHQQQNPAVFVLASALTTSGLRPFVPPHLISWQTFTGQQAAF